MKRYVAKIKFVKKGEKAQGVVIDESGKGYFVLETEG